MKKTVIIELYGDPTDLSMPVLRGQIREAMNELAILPAWKEYYPGNVNIPEYLQKADLPALGINGKIIDNLNESLQAGTCKIRIKEYILVSGEQIETIEKKKRIKMHTSFALSMLVAFFPKCPFCWAAYLSLLGLAGTNTIIYRSWFLPVAIILLLINIFSIFISRNRHQTKPLWLSIMGAILIIANKLFFETTVLVIIGSLLLVSASLWNSLPKRMSLSINYYVASMFRRTGEEGKI